ncbi:MAG: terminase small subunit [Chitinophagaceae bacterium]|nr:MAG: terminase small subunit [Chitinophagaceae bacterium]
MTAKQERFCIEYLKDQNAKQALIRAGYSKNGAAQTAHNTLQVPDVAAYITKELGERKKRAELTKDKVIEEIKKIAFSNIKDFVNGGNTILELKCLDAEKTAAVQGVKTQTVTVKDQTFINQEIKLYNKLDALEKLAKHLGLYEEDNRQRSVIKVGFEDEEAPDEQEEE